MRLGEILIQAGLIDPRQLNAALRHQRLHGGRLGTNLLELGMVSQSALSSVLSQALHVPAATEAMIDRITPDVVRLLPAGLAERYRACPLRLDGKRLHIAMENPGDKEALQRIERITGYELRPFIATDDLLRQAIEKNYGVMLLPVAVALEEEDSFDIDMAWGPASPHPGFPDPYAPEHTGGPRAEVIPLDAVSGATLPPQRPPTRPSIPAVPQAQPAAAPRRTTQPPPSLNTTDPGASPPVVARGTQPPMQPARTAPPSATQPVRTTLPGLGSAGADPTKRVDLYGLGTLLLEARSQNDVIDAALTFLGQDFTRVTMLLHHTGMFVGWRGYCLGVAENSLRGLQFPESDLPVVAEAMRAGLPHLARGSTATLGPLAQVMGAPGKEATLILPARCGGRPIGVFIAVGGREGIETQAGSFGAAAKKLDAAFQILVLRNHIAD